MKENNDISSIQKEYLINKNIPRSYPDVIDQVDKVINKYKKQLENLRSYKNLKELNIQNYPLTEKSKNNKKSNYSENIKNETEPYFSIRNKKIKNNKNYFKTQNNDRNIDEEINEDINNNYKDPEQNKYNYKYELNEYNNENKYNTKNEYNNIKPFNENNNLIPDLTYEIKNDNMKLGSALTLEKSKVVQLLNLLKIKEKEINNLKKQINDFEIKINEIENKYQNIIYSLETQQSKKLNNIYSNLSNEKNKISSDYDEIKRSTEFKFDQINNEIKDSQKILKIFFDLFNKNIDLFVKTEILPLGNNFFINENNYSEENAYLAVKTIDKLINKLVQDNKDLFNELTILNEEIKNNNIICNQNNDYIQKQNSSLKQFINNYSNENNFLKNNRSYNNIKSMPKRKNYEYPENNYSQINNTEIYDNNHHHHIVHSICRHCTPDCFKSNRSNQRDTSPFENLKLKITKLENKIKMQNKTYT